MSLGYWETESNLLVFQLNLVIAAITAEPIASDYGHGSSGLEGLTRPAPRGGSQRGMYPHESFHAT